MHCVQYQVLWFWSAKFGSQVGTHIWSWHDFGDSLDSKSPSLVLQIGLSQLAKRGILICGVNDAKSQHLMWQSIRGVMHCTRRSLIPRLQLSSNWSFSKLRSLFLQYCLRYSKVDLLQGILETHGVHFRIRDYPEAALRSELVSSHCTPALTSGCDKVMMAFLRMVPLDYEDSSDLMIHACNLGFLEPLQYLLEHKCFKGLEIGFEHACIKGHLHIVQYLDQKGHLEWLIGTSEYEPYNLVMNEISTYPRNIPISIRNYLLEYEHDVTTYPPEIPWNPYPKPWISDYRHLYPNDGDCDPERDSDDDYAVYQMAHPDRSLEQLEFHYWGPNPE